MNLVKYIDTLGEKLILVGPLITSEDYILKQDILSIHVSKIANSDLKLIENIYFIGLQRVPILIQSKTSE